MFDVTRLRLLFTVLAGFIMAISACNLGDPITGLPTSGCKDEGDCNDHGTCSVENGVGTCSCDTGYEDDDCGECADGYDERPNGSCELETPMSNMTNNGSNNSTNNNSTGECEDGEVLFEEQCVVDGCAANPCGDGTCEVTGDNSWTCSCPDGTTGIECPRCEDGCQNGTCNAQFECVCDRGWAGTSCNMCAPGFQGAACDTCAANAFGTNCDTCGTINAAEPWWDTNYGVRRALIVFNSENAMLPVLTDVVVQHEFRHDLLVAAGASNPQGMDIRVVNSPDVEVNRVLGFDSMWNANDTTIWFPTVEALAPGGFDVFYVYSNNPTPPAPMNDAAQVLIRERGWYTGQNGPIYAAQPRTGGAYSVHVRQENPQTVQVFFHDASDATASAAEVSFVNTITGQTMDSVMFGSTMGSSAQPANFPEVVTGLPNSMLIEVTFNSGSDSGAVYIGNTEAYSGTGAYAFQVSLTRANNSSAAPQVFECAPEMQP